MKTNSCHKCGSFNLIADRALAGRIICANCGTPISNYAYKSNSPTLNINRNFKNIIIFTVLFILVLILVV